MSKEKDDNNIEKDVSKDKEDVSSLEEIVKKNKKESKEIKDKETPIETFKDNGRTYTYDYIPNGNTKKGMSKDKKYVLIIVIILIFILVCIGGYFGVKAIKDIYELKDNSDKQKIELQYTTTGDDVEDGIYITDVSSVVSNVMPSIVSITSKTLVSSGLFGPSYGQSQYNEGAGSGIIIGKTDTELLILTNNHVVDGASELAVSFINDKSVDASIKGTTERKDIAVISVKITDIDKDTLNSIKIATMGDSSKLKVGNGVIAIGNALGYGQSVTTGVVSALNREVTIDNYTNKMIQIDAAINGGNSGGALINSKGEVVGINSAKYSSSGSSTNASVEGMGFAIPISDVKDIITSLMNGEEVSNGATLGVEGYMTNSSNLSGYKLPVGFYITGITSGSAAEKAGLEIGYIITSIEGENVEQFSDLSNVLYEKKSGDKIKLKVKYPSGREYKEKEIDVTL